MRITPEPPAHPGMARALELILSAAIHQARANACTGAEDAFPHQIRAEIARRAAHGAATRAAATLYRG